MIEVANLTKTFGTFRALDDISLRVERGIVYGLVGPNGAGKTTLLKTLMGILLPTEGRVRINGQDVHRDPGTKSRVGYVADYQAFYPGFRVKDMVQLYQGTFPYWSHGRFNELRKVFDLPDNRKVGKLSKGMRTQLAFLLNLSIMPELLVLDEPTSGLDPVLRRQVLRVLVDDVAMNGTTVLLATHNLHELERICDRIGVIYQGRLITDQSLDELKLQVRRIQVVFPDGMPAELRQKLDILKVEQRGTVYSIVLRGNIDLAMAELRKANPLLLETIDMSLDDIFIHLMGGQGYEFGDLVAQ